MTAGRSGARFFLFPQVVVPIISLHTVISRISFDDPGMGGFCDFIPPRKTNPNAFSFCAAIETVLYRYEGCRHPRNVWRWIIEAVPSSLKGGGETYLSVEVNLGRCSLTSGLEGLLTRQPIVELHAFRVEATDGETGVIQLYWVGSPIS